MNVPGSGSVGAVPATSRAEVVLRIGAGIDAAGFDGARGGASRAARDVLDLATGRYHVCEHGLARARGHQDGYNGSVSHGQGGHYHACYRGLARCRPAPSACYRGLARCRPALSCLLPRSCRMDRGSDGDLHVCCARRESPRNRCGAPLTSASFGFTWHAGFLLFPPWESRTCDNVFSTTGDPKPCAES